MRFSTLKIITASVVLFFGCQTSLMAEVNATGQKADEQPAAQSTGNAPDAQNTGNAPDAQSTGNAPAAQSTAKAPAATIPPQPAWRGYYPHRPYYRPYRRRGSGSGFGFGSGSGPSFGSRRGPGWDDWGRDPFFDDPWRRSGSDSGFGFGSGSGPSWGSRSGPGWGREARPGTAQVYVYPDARDGMVIADVIRLDKGHTEGLEPKITEELIKMMVAAPCGKLSTGGLHQQ